VCQNDPVATAFQQNVAEPATTKASTYTQEGMIHGERWRTLWLELLLGMANLCPLNSI
jgi:hypothetical protein